MTNDNKISVGFSVMDPIYFMPESKQCYDLIDEDLKSSDSIAEPIPPVDSVLSSNDPKAIEDYFLTCCEFGSIENLRKVLEAKADIVKAKDSDGYTGLHRASYNGHVSVISELIQAGASVTAVTEDGWQPLHCACRWSMDVAFSFSLFEAYQIRDWRL